MRVLPPGAVARTITLKMHSMLINVAKNRFALIEALKQLQNAQNATHNNENPKLFILPTEAVNLMSDEKEVKVCK